MSIVRRGRLTVVVSLALAAAAVAAPAPAAMAAGNDCVVKNLTAGGTFTSLQDAVDAANPSATLQVKGKCVGGTTIDRHLTIVGKKTATSGKPTLSGGGLTRVVHVEAGTAVSIRSLTVRDGQAGTDAYPDNAGGGIRNDGTLTLTNVIVRNNRAESGAGVSNEGRVTLNGTTSILRNEASSEGGGAYVFRGTLRLLDQARIHHNSAVSAGGGVLNLAGVVVMSGRSSIDSNEAEFGGGIESEESGGDAPVFRMKRASSIHHNTTTGYGAAFNGEGTFTMEGTSVIRDNDSSSTATSGTVEIWSYGIPTTFTMKGSSRIRNNAAGAGGAGVVKWRDCSTEIPTLVGVKTRLSGNTPRNFFVHKGDEDC